MTGFDSSDLDKAFDLLPSLHVYAISVTLVEKSWLRPCQGVSGVLASYPILSTFRQFPVSEIIGAYTGFLSGGGDK